MKILMVLLLATIVYGICYTECYDSDHPDDCVVQLEVINKNGKRYIISLDHNISYLLEEQYK